MRISNCAFIFLCLIASVACSSRATADVKGNGPLPEQAATPAKPASTPAPAAASAPPGSLATPTDAYLTAYAVRGKKDVAGMKRIMSKEVLEFLTRIAEGLDRTLDQEIAHMLKKQRPKVPKVRNEKIVGDRASVEFMLDGGLWKTLDFVKEGSEWKLALPPKDPADQDQPNDQGEP